MTARRAGRPRRARVTGLALCAPVAALLLASCGGSPAASPSTGASGTSAGPTTTGTAATVPHQGPPTVPVTGAYLGAWLHPVPTGAAGSSFAAEQRATPAVVAATGRPLGILHVFVSWHAPAPVADLRAIAAAGSVPMLDWGCAPDGTAVSTGADDALIAAFATALRGYGGPVLLRWCWEMNLVRSHPQVGGPTGFIGAWSRIRSVFARVGAHNASFVWCPALTGVDPTPYFPGLASVDWIGVDGYDRDGTQTFAPLFTPFYRRWATLGRPMVVAETGAIGSAQPGFIASIGTGMPVLPGFKAVVYFDGVGPAASWVLTPAGLGAFAALARDPYFAPG